MSNEPSWIKRQQDYYQAFPHAHLQFDQESVYAANIVDEVLKQTRLQTENKVLEVGCGSGRFTLHLIRKGFCLTALDLSVEQLHNLKEAARKQGLNSDLLAVQSGEISASDALFGQEEFHGIMGFFILHHLEDVRSDLRSLRRSLQPGGAITFVEPNRLNPLFFLQIFLCKDMTWKGEKGTFRCGASGYRRCFEAEGYTDVKIKKFGFFPPQVLDRFPFMLGVEKWLERIPFVKIFLPFLLIAARKPIPAGA